jgi:hypothetical protein
MDKDDVGFYTHEGDFKELLASQVVYFEIAARVMVPRELVTAVEKLTLGQWIEYAVNNSIEVRGDKLRMGIPAAECQKGHIVPADELKWVPGLPADKDEPPTPAWQDCPDCAEEALAEAERRAER